VTTWALACLILAAVGCGAPSELQSPEQLTLYSIDGRWFRGGADGDCGPGARELVDAPEYIPPAGVKVTEHFHDYPVLGKVEITDPQQRQRIVAALKEGLRKGDISKCFCPRHAVRAVEKGHTFEYLICFQCNDFAELIDGNRKRSGPVGDGVKSVFDQPLRDAGILIAP
jgi:hypothetical protein